MALVVVVALLVIAIAGLISRCRRIVARRREQLHPTTNDARSARSLVEPKSAVGRRRRRAPQRLSPDDEASVAHYNAELLAATSGARGDVDLPDVALHKLQQGEDIRSRCVEPFEMSYLVALLVALEPLPGARPWWEWLEDDDTARALFDTAVNGILNGADAESKAFCIALLETWLLQADGFSALRCAVSELVTTADGRKLTIPELHKREADAYEHKYAKDWLLVSLMETMKPALRRKGMIATCPPRPPCPSCFRPYDLSRRGSVELVCFLPCGHWTCNKCLLTRQVVAHGHELWCPECNVESLPMRRKWPGAMVELE